MSWLQLIWNLLSVAACLAAVALGVLYRELWRRSRDSRQAIEEAQQQLAREAQARYKTERLLQDRQEWSETLFNNSLDMVFIHGVTDAGLPGPFQQVNDAACRQLGYTREKLTALTPMDIEDTPEAVATLGYTRSELAVLTDAQIAQRQNVTSQARQTVTRIIQERQVLYERVFVTRTGRRFPVEISARCFNTEGTPTIMCTAHDVTERHRMRQALTESEQRFQDFFAHSPIGVATYDSERKLVNVNPACLRMFGTPDRQEFGRFDLFDNVWLSDEARRNLKKGESSAYEAEVDFDGIRKLGALVTNRNGRAHFDLMIHNLGLDRDYKPKGFLAQIQDVTRRREAENALLLSERQLRQAQKMQAIGTLAGGIAHDFNNILTPIIGYTEIVLQCDSGDAATQDYLREVLKASHRAKDLVNQILTFSRQSELSGSPIQVSTIIKEVVKQFQATQPQNIEIRTLLKSESDVVVASPTQLHQVIMNLCTNAIHAMKETGGTLDIATASFLHRHRVRSAYPALAPGRYLRISVRDTGTGMDEATIERVFEPFFTTKASGEGTGMGLAVVHGIVSSLKGAISVESKLGVGSVFHVVLPLVERLQADEEESAAPMPTGRETILFVDDERDIVKMQTHMLTTLGYNPVMANSAEEALRLFALNPDRFDLIITDQVMPGMSGTELAKAILGIRPNMPIILSTGFSDVVTPEQARALGVREFMLKPVVMRHMAETIRRALSTTAPAPTAPAQT